MEIAQRMFDLLDVIPEGQQRLSEFAGISPKTISAWKSRRTDPPAKHISAIAEFLNISVTYLLTGNDSELILSENEKELLHLLHELPSERDQVKFIGKAELIVKEMKLDKAIKDGKKDMETAM